MARMSCIVVSNVPHHVTQLGNRRMRTFFNANDYEAILAIFENLMGKVLGIVNRAISTYLRGPT